MESERFIRSSNTTCFAELSVDLPTPYNAYQPSHADLLCNSYERWTGKSLITEDFASASKAEYLFKAPFALLSHHKPLQDPILNYGNLTVLELFGLSWDELQQMPSRLTAEPQVRQERACLMKRVSDNGFIDDYSGVRISKSGKRFLIERATVWNLIDSDGIYQGQAAVFSDLIELTEKVGD